MSSFTLAVPPFEYANSRSCIRTETRGRPATGQVCGRGGGQPSRRPLVGRRLDGSAVDGGAHLAELLRRRAAEEGDGDDADDSDQGDEEGVLDEAGALLVGAEPGSQIGQVKGNRHAGVLVSIGPEEASLRDAPFLDR